MAPDDILYACNLIAKNKTGFDPANEVRDEDRQLFEQAIDRCLLDQGFDSIFTAVVSNAKTREESNAWLIGTWECTSIVWDSEAVTGVITEFSFVYLLNYSFRPKANNYFEVEVNSIAQLGFDLPSQAVSSNGLAKLRKGRLSISSDRDMLQSYREEYGPKPRLSKLKPTLKQRVFDVQFSDSSMQLSRTSYRQEIYCVKATDDYQPRKYDLAEYRANKIDLVPMQHR